MTLQLLFKALASPLQGFFFFSPERDRGLDAKTRSRTKNLSKSYFIWGYRRKKFPNSNPAGDSATKPLNSRNFPLFPGISRFQSLPSNINAAIRPSGSKKNDRAAARKKTIYQSTAVCWFEDLTAPPRAKNRALHSAPAAKNPARRLRQPVGNADISG